LLEEMIFEQPINEVTAMSEVDEKADAEHT
jgi:hypothetical protein